MLRGKVEEKLKSWIFSRNVDLDNKSVSQSWIEFHNHGFEFHKHGYILEIRKGASKSIVLRK